MPLFDSASGGSGTVSGTAGNIAKFTDATTAGNSLLSEDAANTVVQRNGANAQTSVVHGTYTDANNYRRLRTTMTTGGAATIAAESLSAGVAGSGNTLAISINGAATAAMLFDPAAGTLTVSSAYVFVASNTYASGNIAGNSGTAIYWTSRSAMTSPVDGQIFFRNNDTSDADFFLKLGLNTSAAAGIKRVGTTIQTRLNDDSAFAATQSLYDRFGSGTPEAAVTAPVGTTYHRTDGGAGTSLYVKESGTGNTGWVGK